MIRLGTGIDVAKRTRYHVRSAFTLIACNCILSRFDTIVGHETRTAKICDSVYILVGNDTVPNRQTRVRQRRAPAAVHLKIVKTPKRRQMSIVNRIQTVHVKLRPNENVLWQMDSSSD